MPLPTPLEWVRTMRENRLVFRDDDLNFQIGQMLKIIDRTNGFTRYQALGGLHKMLVAGYAWGGAFQNGAPVHIVPLIPALMDELREIAFFVGQNEFSTIGPRDNTCPLIYSTGFFRCVGLVLFDGASLIATLAHVAPATAAQMSVDRTVEDFVEAGGDLRGAKTLALIVGGREGETDKSKRAELREALEKVTATVRHVPLSELGVDNGWGFHFNRMTGAYAAVPGSPVQLLVSTEPTLGLMSQRRSNSNVVNDNKGAKAELLPATRF